MTPVHADLMDRAVGRESGHVGEGGAQETGEARPVHLARRHRELAVPGLSEAGDVAPDRDVERRVGEDHPGALVVHQRLVGRCLQGRAAIEAMLAEEPKVACLRNSRPGLRLRDLVLVFPIGCGLLVQDEVDLAGGEAGEREVEVEVRQLLEFDRQQRIVPAGQLRELVVGDDIGTPLGLAQVLEADDRHALQPQELRRGDPAVAGEDHAPSIDQDWIGEAEAPDRIGDPADLLPGMGAGVARIGAQRRERTVVDFQAIVPELGFNESHRRASRRSGTSAFADRNALQSVAQLMGGVEQLQHHGRLAHMAEVLQTLQQGRDGGADITRSQTVLRPDRDMDGIGFVPRDGHQEAHQVGPLGQEAAGEEVVEVVVLEARSDMPGRQAQDAPELGFQFPSDRTQEAYSRSLFEAAVEKAKADQEREGVIEAVGNLGPLARGRAVVEGIDRIGLAARLKRQLPVEVEQALDVGLETGVRGPVLSLPIGDACNGPRDLVAFVVFGRFAHAKRDSRAFTGGQLGYY